MASKRILLMMLLICFFSCNNEKRLEKHDGNDSIINIDNVITPIKESGIENENLELFLEELKTAVISKDKDKLIPLCDEDIVSSHGGGIMGISNFIEFWNLDSLGVKSKLWPLLSKSILLGGDWEIDSNSYIFPYYQSDKHYTNTDLDWYDIGVCLSDSIQVYETESLHGKGIGWYSYDIVEIVEDKGEVLEVRSEVNGLKGFVDKDEMGRTTDYKIVITESKDSKWSIESVSR